MKIKAIRSTPVRIGFAEPEIWPRDQRIAVTCISVEVETDKGIVGIGESVPAPDPHLTIAAIEMVAKRPVV